MTSNFDNNIAEAVGRRVLQWKGSEFLEFIYLMEEQKTLSFIRLFAAMSHDTQEALIQFMECVSQLENPELRVDPSGLHIETE